MPTPEFGIFVEHPLCIQRERLQHLESQVAGQAGQCRKRTLSFIAISSPGFRQKFSNARADLISDFAERGQPLTVGALHGSGILEAPMQALGFSRKYRTSFFRAVADGNNVIEVLTDELIHKLRIVAGNIDLDLVHDFDRFRPDIRWPSACAKRFEPIPCDVPEQPFGHLAPRGIAGADEQQFFPI
jgi:hypothetical protein